MYVILSIVYSVVVVLSSMPHPQTIESCLKVMRHGLDDITDIIAFVLGSLAAFQIRRVQFGEFIVRFFAAFVVLNSIIHLSHVFP